MNWLKSWDNNHIVEKNNKSGEYLFILSGNYYFCAMIRNLFSFFIILFFSAGITTAQPFVSTSDLFKRTDGNFKAGQFKITQDRALDTLITRYILASGNRKTSEGTQGMDGFRIQIYYSSVRTAREEASRARAEFLSKFPDIKSYEEYAEPGYFMVRAGDYRTKAQGYKYLLLIRKEFPNAYFVPTVINFPDLNIK